MRQSAELLEAIDKAGRGNAVKAEGKVRARGCFGGFEWFLARRATVKRPFQTLGLIYIDLVEKAGQSLNFLF